MVKVRNTFIPNDPNVHRNLGGPFVEGSAFTSAIAITVDVVLSAAGMVRVWWKDSAGGTLDFAWLRSGADDVYDTAAVSPVTTTADTEVATVLTAMGERGLRITFTPGADGTITYADIAAILGIQG